MSTLDYWEVDTILMFEACETRVCTNVTIVDDDVAELTERFFARLGRTVGLDTRITLDPVEAEIEIIDGDGEWMNNVINWHSILFVYLIPVQGLCLFMYTTVYLRYP